MNIIRKHNRIFKRSLIILSILILALLYIYIGTFKEIVNILLISFILAYILKPVKELIVKKTKMKGSLAAIIIIFGIILVVFISIILLIPVLFKEINNIGPTLDSISKYIEAIGRNFKISESAFIRFLYEEARGKISGVIFSFSQGIADKIISLSENILSFAVVPVVTYYFLADNGDISKKFYLLIPVEKRILTKKIISDIDRLLQRYILSQLILSLIIGVLTFFILILIGIRFPLWLSILNGIFNIIPYFGPIFGAIPIIFIALLDSPTKALWAGVAILLIQQIEGNILSPKITGDSTNMHPLVIIILLLIGEKIGGFVGMIVIVPIGVIIKVIYDDINYYLF